MARRRFPSRLVARLLLVSLAPFTLDGCVSIGLSRSVREGTRPATGELSVGIYRKASDRDTGRPVDFPVLAELARLDGATRTVVARSMAATWTIGELAPGRYVLRAAKKIDGRGDVVPLGGPVEKEFDLAAGERVDAKIVLEKVPVLLVVLAVVTVVILVFVLLDILKDGDVHLPPPPPLPPGLVQVALEVPFRVALGSRGVEPGVADVFPAPGSVVAARRVSVSFLMSVPIDGTRIENGAVLAVGSLSGEIPGDVDWMPDDRLLRFVPRQDFRPGETVHVTLDLEKVESAGGREGKGRVSTSFRVP